MRLNPDMFRTTLATLTSLTLTIAISIADEEKPNPPQKLRDLLWVWGIPEMATDGPNTAATYANASPSERAKLLGAENIILAGAGVPLDFAEADRLTEAACDAKRLIWEILPDDATSGYTTKSTFDYSHRLDVICRLAQKYPKIEAVLLDDMSTEAVSKGLRPRHIQAIHDTLKSKNTSLQTWGVVYTMNLDEQDLPALVKELDVILFCEWSADKLLELESSVRRLKRMFPDKPIVLGTYMYDYSTNRNMTQESLRHQYSVALKLAREGLIDGVEFTSITNDRAAVELTSDWINQIGEQSVRAN